MTTPTKTLLAASALSTLLLAACGGGGDGGVDLLSTAAMQSAQPVAAQAQAQARTVRLEGCVVDTQWQGATDVAVHARTADGRVVGTAYTGALGVFVMTVPARAGIVLDTAVGGAGGLSITTGTTALSVGACLLHDL